MSEQSETLRQSRVGKRPVPVPAGVTVTISGDRAVKVKGPKGELERTFHDDVVIKQTGEGVVVTPNGKPRRFAQFQGLSRALLRNMIEGVSDGYKISLDLFGVGYRATIEGQTLTLSLGLSHQVVHTLRPGVSATIETIDDGGTKRPRVHLASCNKESLGQDAAQIRSYRPPEPYKGKGVRYTGERIREKAGKTGS
ncbi:MAG: 50S ribosomal protein L6 [Sandaracinaceae bacterium]|nr:50S ribosomal protein L6 [Sandaracinaceae bacterium]